MARARRSKRGRMEEDGAIAILTGQIRRKLSLTATRENARCLLKRVDRLGKGSGAAEGRRRRSGQEGWRMARKQRAHWLGGQRGRPEYFCAKENIFAWNNFPCVCVCLSLLSGGRAHSF